MRLDDLISQVQQSAVTEEPLDRLAAAMGVKAEIDEVTDSLIGHFVDQARRAGCSWSEIGSAMGVSKQAAQQRHTSERPPRSGPRGMFTRFTGRARTAVQQAGVIAGELDRTFIGTEHLLLGVLADADALGTKALVALGVDPADVRRAVEAADVEDGDPPRRRRHRPFTPGAKKVLELSLREAVALAHNYVGTEHLVLALQREKDGMAAKILRECGIERDALIEEIRNRLAAA